jgi:hypothetical protein
MRIQRMFLVLAVVALSVVPSVAGGTTGSLAGAAASPVAVWEMNEASGSPVMFDSSGNARDGQVGAEVRTGVANDTGAGYRWIFTQPNQPPAKPERLVTIADGAGLDPGDRVYSITFRYKTTQNFGNYLQKGQATTPGGQIKVQAPQGKVSCLFKGSLGRSATSSKTPLNDGAWHVITCRRDETGVSMYVDGEFRNRNRGATGYIDNSFPMTIGGKPKCDQIKVTCDYFSGQFDWVRVDAG